MSVTEQLMGWGSWSLRLKGLPNDTTPSAVWEALDPDTNGFGHILITPTRVDPNSLGDAGMLAASRYTGIYRGGGSRNEISGIGLVGWLGDEDGKGDIYETAKTGGTGSFEDWVTDLLPDAITKGTVSAIAGTLTQSIRYQSPLAALGLVMDYFGGMFRVNPDGSLDAGAQDDLFADTPEVLLTWMGSGPDAEVDGIRASQIDLSRDLEDWSSRVVLLAEGSGAAVATGAANISSNPYKDLHGNAAVRKRLVNAPDVASGNANTLAAAQLGRFDETRKAYSLSTDEWGVRVRGKRPEPGDNIYVYDPRPDAKLRDDSNQVYFQGQLVMPVVMRLEAITWPVQEGMGVYFRYYDGATPVYVDLTHHVEFETGATTLDVGAAPRTLTTDLTPAQVQTRLSTSTPLDVAEVLAGTAASLTLTVPDGWGHAVRVVGGGRSNAAQLRTGLRLTLNNTTTANTYRGQLVTFAGTTTTPTVTATSDTSLVVCQIAADTANAGVVGFADILVLRQPGASVRGLLFSGGVSPTADNAESRHDHGVARATVSAAFTTIELFPNSGAFMVGTRFELWPG